MSSFSYDPIDRTHYLAGARRGVVKLGSEAVVTKEGKLNYKVLKNKADEAANAYTNGMDIAVVTSGAIALGSFGEYPGEMSITQKQVAAAVGQPLLMSEYNELLGQHGLNAAQMLLLSGEFVDPKEFSRIRAVCKSLFDTVYAMPIINANDPLSIEEIEKYDNDTLAAKLSVAIGADYLIIYIAGKRNGGDVEGFYDREPDDPEARLIKTVYNIDEEIRNFAVEKEGGPIITRGGYASKNTAAEIATYAGVPVIVANVKYSLNSILSGEDVGTFYVPRPRKLITPDTPDDVAFELMQELFSEVERAA